MPGVADYLAQLQALLPQGAVWSRSAESTLTATLEGVAAELARVEARGVDLMVQTDPRVVTEMLSDWERSWGLPDGCVTASPTPAGRRLALHQRVAGMGGQSAQYFVGLAVLLGYEAEVETYRPTRLPFPIPTPVLGRPWAFAWRLAVYGPAEHVEEPVYASADLGCVVERLKPGHTVVAVDYSPEPEPTFYFDFLTPPEA